MFKGQTIVTIQSDNSGDKSIASEMCLVNYPMLQEGSVPFFFFLISGRYLDLGTSLPGLLFL
jgi:hypothetical protein